MFLDKGCGLHAASEEECATQDCSLTIFVGFAGSDRNGVALQTGSQISRLNQYSVASLYNNVVAQVWALHLPCCLLCGCTLNTPGMRLHSGTNNHTASTHDCGHAIGGLWTFKHACACWRGKGYCCGCAGILHTCHCAAG